MRKRKLALRLYAFTAIITLVAMAALYVLPRFVGSPKFLEPQAALVQDMVDGMSTRLREDPARFKKSMARRTQRLHGVLSLFDRDGHLVRTTAEPALSGATP